MGLFPDRCKTFPRSLKHRFPPPQYLSPSDCTQDCMVLSPRLLLALMAFEGTFQAV
jgi:hypothetical protein